MITNNPSPSIFPLFFGSATVAGRKKGMQSWNEDYTDQFTLNFKTKNGDIQALCFYLADGHGETMRRAPAKSLESFGSRGEQFIALLSKILPKTLYSIISKSLQTLTGSKLNSITSITSNLQNLHSLLDADLKSTATPGLLNDNGSTLVLCLVMLGKVWFLNIGDSSMMIFENNSLNSSDDEDFPSSYKQVMKVWKREQDEEFESCSFEDTLAHYPLELREGQNLPAVEKDYVTIRKFVAQVYMRGFPYHRINSKRSVYGLGMTNTLGNLNHKGNLVGLNGNGRTSVYEFDLEELKKKTINGFTPVFVSDGIKDILKTTEILSIFQGLEKCITNLSPLPPTSPIEDQIDSITTISNDTHSQRAKQLLLELCMKEADQRLDLDDLCSALVAFAIVKGGHDDASCMAVEFGLGWMCEEVLEPIFVEEDVGELAVDVESGFIEVDVCMDVIGQFVANDNVAVKVEEFVSLDVVVVNSDDVVEVSDMVIVKEVSSTVVVSNTQELIVGCANVLMAESNIAEEDDEILNTKIDATLDITSKLQTEVSDYILSISDEFNCQPSILNFISSKSDVELIDNLPNIQTDISNPITSKSDDKLMKILPIIQTDILNPIMSKSDVELIDNLQNIQTDVSNPIMSKSDDDFMDNVPNIQTDISNPISSKSRDELMKNLPKIQTDISNSIMPKSSDELMEILPNIQTDISISIMSKSDELIDNLPNIQSDISNPISLMITDLIKTSTIFKPKILNLVLTESTKVQKEPLKKSIPNTEKYLNLNHDSIMTDSVVNDDTNKSTITNGPRRIPEISLLDEENTLGSVVYEQSGGDGESKGFDDGGGIVDGISDDVQIGDQSNVESDESSVGSGKREFDGCDDFTPKRKKVI